MRQEFRIAALMFVPYVVVTLSTLGVAPASNGLQAEPGAASAALVQLAMQGAYEDCRRKLEPVAAGSNPRDAGDLAPRDAGPRTQSPAWLQKRHIEMENCLRKAAGAALLSAQPEQAVTRL